MPAKKSRKVKAAANSKAFISKRKLQGNISLEQKSDSEADVDYEDLIRDERTTKYDELSTDDEELIRQEEESSEEEEILPITDDEKDYSEDETKYDEDDDYDEEEDNYNEEEGLPNREAWGKRKSIYFNADFVDQDRGKSYREEDAEKAQLEEEEALTIQRNLYSYIPDDEDIQVVELENLTETQKEEVEDLQALSKEEKIKYLKRKFPECLLYIKEFKEKMTEIKDKLLPLLAFEKEGKILSKEYSEFLQYRYQILQHYCMNISFYMALKSNDTITSNHPVLQRINSFKNLSDQMLGPEKNYEILNKLYQKIEKEAKKVKSTFVSKELDNKQTKLRENNSYSVTSVSSTKKTDKIKKFKQLETEEERKITSLYKQSKESQMNIEEPGDQDVEMKTEETAVAEFGTDEKRTITYEIAKNKGLTVRRKKERRNPRVHHRTKFRKAKIRRKGQVREAIKEVRRYQGEPTGISAHVVKSIRIK